MNLKSFFLTVVSVSFLFIFTGCFDLDSNASTGENGVLRYALYTDYEAAGDLGTGILPTLVTHRISVYSTGAEHLGRYDEIYHVIEPSENAIIISGDNEYSVPDLTLKVSKSGTYTIVTKNPEKELDRIKLKFETPASLEVVTKVREPYKKTFVKATGSGTITTEEGTQIVFIPYFYTSSNVRMIGDIDCEYTADPQWMVVPDVEWVDETENSSWTSNYASSYYLIEEGDVEFTIWHEESGITGTQKFNVTAADKD